MRTPHSPLADTDITTGIVGFDSALTINSRGFVIGGVNAVRFNIPQDAHLFREKLTGFAENQGLTHAILDCPTFEGAFHELKGLTRAAFRKRFDLLVFYRVGTPTQNALIALLGELNGTTVIVIEVSPHNRWKTGVSHASHFTVEVHPASEQHFRNVRISKNHSGPVYESRALWPTP